MKHPSLPLKLFALVVAMMCALGMQAAEAYANYTPSNTTLTFYYDDLRSTRTGTTYDLDYWPGWYSDGTNANVTKVVFNSSFAAARPVTTYLWFCGMGNLLSVTGIAYLNTDEVTNMGNMFSGCSSLASLDLSHFNTSNVTNMYAMFSDCQSLTSLNVSNFITSKVMNMSYMFRGCKILESIDVSNFNTANVTNMENMFNNCRALTSLDLSSFNTANVTNMNAMFWLCMGLISLDVSSFNTANVTDMSMMFDYCNNLISLDLSNFNTANVTTMERMFEECNKLTSLDVSNFNTAKVTDMSNLLQRCKLLTSLDLSSFNTSLVTDMSFMFDGCSQLGTILVRDSWSTASVQSSLYMFRDCTSLVGGMGTTYDASHVNAAYAHIDGGTSNPGYLTKKVYDFMVDGIYYNITGANTVEVTYGSETDNNNCYSGNVSIPITVNHGGTTYRVTAIGARAFYPCESLTSVSIPASVTLIDTYAFSGCKALTGVTIPASVTRINSYAFSYCSGLTSVTIPGSVKFIGGSAFSNCTNITSLNLNQGTDTIGAYCFMGCSSLPGVVIPNSVKYMGSNAFYYCQALKNVTFSTSLTQINGYAFAYTALETVDIPEGIKAIYAHAFQQCGSLKSVTLPSTLTTLNSAFDVCQSLRTVICKAVTPPTPVNSDCFWSETYSDGVLYVPRASVDDYKAANYWKNFYTILPYISLDDALNADGSSIHFESTGDYPWLAVEEYGLEYAMSGNAGVASSTSTLTAIVTAASGDILFFDFKAWGEGTSTIWDRCSFSINGIEQIAYGAYQNEEWETCSVYLPAGECTLEWKYTKDSSVNNPGDYFAIDNVAIKPKALRGDVNGDGSVNISDVTTLIDYLLSGNANGVNLTAADCNQDGSINISDVTTLIDYLLSGSW